MPTPEARFRLAPRMAEIQPFYVMELLGRAKALEAAGRDIVHMEVGEPDFPTPEPVLEAVREALVHGRMFYTPALGMPELRAAIAGFYRDRYGVEVAPERILVTPGASGALQLATAVLLAPGEALLMADPGYPCNRHFARLVEARAVSVPVGPESGYQLTAAQVEAHWTTETAAALVASPSNPTGTVVERAEMAAIAAAVHRRGGRLLVDEIYNGLVYEGDVTTALAITDEAFVINSFSKYFGMTGWRIGWLVAPPAYVRDLEKLAQNLFISAPTPSQYAALAALRPETLAIAEERRLAFRERRDYLLPALRELGFRIPVTPQGAFYLYADISAFGNDSHRFAMDLLERAGVAVTPGLDFGTNAPGRHVRFAYTTSLPRLEEAVARIRAYLEGP